MPTDASYATRVCRRNVTSRCIAAGVAALTAALLLAACVSQSAGTAAIAPGVGPVQAPSTSTTPRPGGVAPITMTSSFSNAESILAAIAAAGIPCEGKRAVVPQYNEVEQILCTESGYKVSTFADAGEVQIEKERADSWYGKSTPEFPDNWYAFGDTWVIQCADTHPKCAQLQLVLGKGMVPYSQTAMAPLPAAAQSLTVSVRFDTAAALLAAVEAARVNCVKQFPSDPYEGSLGGIYCAESEYAGRTYSLVMYSDEAHVAIERARVDAFYADRVDTMAYSDSWIAYGKNWTISCDKSPECKILQQIFGADMTFHHRETPTSSPAAPTTPT